MYLTVCGFDTVVLICRQGGGFELFQDRESGTEERGAEP